MQWAPTFAEDGHQVVYETENRIGSVQYSQDGQTLFITEIEASIAEYLERLLERGTKTITTLEVFRDALNLNPDSDKYAEQATRLGAQMSAALARCHWYKDKDVGRGKTKRRIYRYQGE